MEYILAVNGHSVKVQWYSRDHSRHRQVASVGDGTITQIGHSGYRGASLEKTAGGLFLTQECLVYWVQRENFALCSSCSPSSTQNREI